MSDTDFNYMRKRLRSAGNPFTIMCQADMLPCSHSSQYSKALQQNKSGITVRLPAGREWKRPTWDEEAELAAAARSMLRALVIISSHILFTCSSTATPDLRNMLKNGGREMTKTAICHFYWPNDRFQRSKDI